MHFGKSAAILASAVHTSAKLRVVPEFLHPGVIVGLYGSGCERVPRNRGRPVYVAPLLCLGQDVWAWLGYREEWYKEGSNRRDLRYSFRSVSLSIHFGLRNTVFKPQMFRAEWAGWARWSGSDYGFQAANSGHPHWHFDALDIVSEDSGSERAAQLLSGLRPEAESEIHTFSPELSDAAVRGFVTAQKVSRIHFASATAWWKSLPLGEHVHGPASLAHVENWVRHSLDYIKSELEGL